MKRWCVLFAPAAFAVLLLVGCYVEFENPLPPAADLKADRELVGSWTVNRPDGEAYLHVYARSNGWIDLFFITRESEDRMDVVQREGYTARVGDTRVLCVSPGPQKGEGREKEGWMLFPYEIGPDGSLRIWDLEVPAFEKLVESRQLTGEVTGSKRTRGVKVRSSSDELQAFFSKHGIKPFAGEDPWMVFGKTGGNERAI